MLLIANEALRRKSKAREKMLKCPSGKNTADTGSLPLIHIPEQHNHQTKTESKSDKICSTGSHTYVHVLFLCHLNSFTTGYLCSMRWAKDRRERVN
jgi:hypothetical protein